MKITPEILENGVWLSEDIFRYKGSKFKKLICKKCGEECLSLAKKKRKEVYCDRNCCLRDSDKKESEQLILMNGKRIKANPRWEKRIIFIKNTILMKLN